MFNGSSILVSGGTGSFGQKFISTLLERYDPRRVIVFSRDELKQFDMQQSFSNPQIRYFIGDVRDYPRLKQAMHDVDFVVHAAAMKQVPAAEYNPLECVKTNIYGAENVIRAATECGVRKIIALSTDKAAYPVNLYGSTKLVSDKLFVAANNMVGERDIQFSVVRYGNVSCSRGSVVPFFKKLLAEGHTSLPITHHQMTRFWITLSEGVDFVLNSFLRMQGGEVFVPKIPSVRIKDLARALKEDVDLHTVGLRPGEKLHEVLCTADESHLTLDFSDHYVIQPAIQFNRNSDFSENAMGERGSVVPDRFEFNSGTNEKFLEQEALLRCSQ